ncbi:hypothetical protein [Actinoplanes sp. NPDC049316]|uniref:hypothetical protein n=1 Tax=Actinoplanes sp. NPDC049316 TaxID=3154727 RepID=UPI0034242C2A
MPMRVMGQRAVGICGTRATEFFYGDTHLVRHTALPHLVVASRFGEGAVHTLDAEAHRVRKALFVSLLMDDGIDAVAKLAGEAFDEAADAWRGGPPVALFDESARVIARAVTRWTGVPLADDEVDGLAADLVAMVDGFATVGPRHWRALAARRRRERWLAGLISGVRAKHVPVAADSALARIAFFEEDGGPLDHWPATGTALRTGDDDYTTAFGSWGVSRVSSTSSRRAAVSRARVTAAPARR